MVVVMVVAQQIDNHFISPVVMKRAVHLHPAAVMMALLLGGTLGGFFGLLIAVPLAACLKIVLGHLWRKYVLGQSVPGLDEPLPDPSAVAAAASAGGASVDGAGTVTVGSVSRTDEPEAGAAVP